MNFARGKKSGKARPTVGAEGRKKHVPIKASSSSSDDEVQNVLRDSNSESETDESDSVKGVQMGGSSSEDEQDTREYVDQDESEEESSSKKWKKKMEDEIGKIEKNRWAWGKNKNVFYSSDTVDYETDETENAEKAELTAVNEEQPILAERYAAAAQETLNEVTQIAKQLGKKTNIDSVSTIRVIGKIESLTKDEKLKQVVADSPELLGILEEFKTKVHELRAELGPLMEKVKAMDHTVTTNEGISFLQLKFQLLLSYCINIVFYLLLKASGRNVKDHPAINRLVQIRCILEKIKPIDKKLKYQVDKLLQLEVESNISADPSVQPDIAAKDLDLSAFKPRLGQMKSGKAAEKTAEDDVYFDAGLADPGVMSKGLDSHALAMNVDGRGATKLAGRRGMGAMKPGGAERLTKEQRRLQELKKRVSKSSFVQEEILGNVGDGPIEESATGLPGRGRNTEEAARNRYEEANYLRLSETKEQAKKRKRAEREYNRSIGGFDTGDFADIGELAELAERKMKRDEADRAALEALRNRTRPTTSAGSVATGFDGENGGEFDRMDTFDETAESKGFDEADAEFYASENQRVEEKRASKKAKKQEAIFVTPKEDYLDEGSRRHAGKKIVKNRGLVRPRPRKSSNPRTAYRHKHEKAMIKRRTQVKDYKGKTINYSGEATGIKKSAIRSTQLS